MFGVFVAAFPFPLEVFDVDELDAAVPLAALLELLFPRVDELDPPLLLFFPVFGFVVAAGIGVLFAFLLM